MIKRETWKEYINDIKNLEIKATRLETGLKEANKIIHAEFCRGDSHHKLCLRCSSFLEAEFEKELGIQ